MVVDGKKWCPRCREHKDVNQFYKIPSRNGELGAYCVGCSKIIRKEYSLKHPEYNSSQRRLWAVKNKIKQKARALLGGARSRAKSQGKSCTLTIEWVLERLTRGVCEKTGLPFRIVVYETSRWECSTHQDSPSIDAIDPDGDYTTDNSRLVWNAFNCAKGSGTDELVDLMAEALVKTKRKRERLDKKNKGHKQADKAYKQPRDKDLFELSEVA